MTAVEAPSSWLPLYWASFNIFSLNMFCCVGKKFEQPSQTPHWGQHQCLQVWTVPASWLSVVDQREVVHCYVSVRADRKGSMDSWQNIHTPVFSVDQSTQFLSFHSRHVCLHLPFLPFCMQCCFLNFTFLRCSTVPFCITASVSVSIVLWFIVLGSKVPLQKERNRRFALHA